MSGATARRGKCYDASRQQQHHPAAEKEPGGVDQVGVNKISIHSRTSRNHDSADVPLLQLRFSSQVFVLIENLADGVEAAERSQMYIGKRLLDLRHPAFDSPLDSGRHLTGEGIYNIRWDGCTGQESTRLS
jgi:hypothetical protein